MPAAEPARGSGRRPFSGNKDGDNGDMKWSQRYASACGVYRRVPAYALKFGEKKDKLLSQTGTMERKCDKRFAL
jgi:hypothetical protein